MDTITPTAIVTFIASAGIAIVTAVVIIVVGTRRGLRQVDEAADRETAKLLAAQAARITFLEAENARLVAQVETLTRGMAELKADLAVEKRISARFRDEASS